MAATPDAMFRRYRVPSDDGDDTITWRFVCGQCPRDKTYRRGHLVPDLRVAMQAYLTHYDQFHITMEEATR